MKSQLALFTLALGLVACQSTESSKTEDQEAQKEVVGNPPADGFNQVESDQQAIRIADQVMEAMGGRENWDNTRILCWNFFGYRSLIWDKWSGDVRIEVPRDEMTILMNIHSGEGRVNQRGEEITHPDSLAHYLDRGMSIWINDSYWLLMPYKLKDSGVTLKYMGEETTEEGKTADMLELTFKEVGKTPDNRYEVCVDKDTRLVTQWAFFRHYEDDSAAFVNRWADYKTHGDILLSGNRGQREITDIAVLDSVPAVVFEAFDPVDLPGQL